MFAVADLDVSKDWEINFGVGIGATAATDHLIFKAILGRRLNWGQAGSVQVTWRRVHQLLALSLAVFWLIQVLTGVLLTFRQEIGHFLAGGRDAPLRVELLGRPHTVHSGRRKHRYLGLGNQLHGHTVRRSIYGSRQQRTQDAGEWGR